MMFSRSHRAGRGDTWCRQKSRGNSTLLTIGFSIVSVLFGVIAIDLPMYYVYQNQLQTAVNAAALAGASDLPMGQAYAEEAALELAAENPVAGKALTASELEFSYVSAQNMTMEVRGHTQAPTMFARLACAMKGVVDQGGGFQGEGGSESGSSAGGSNGGEGCEYMTIYANAKAIPAARDTILVIDNSSSMISLGNNRPMSDVKSAARQYVDQVLSLNVETTDRIGLVKFAYDGTKLAGLKSQKEDPKFGTLKSKISGISAYDAQGWNTNYEAGLKLAVEELKANGRPNAQKIVLFMTDGKPNLPAPPNYYTYSKYQPYNKCVDPVHNRIKNSPYRERACTYNKSTRKWSCPTMPSSKITPDMIFQSEVSCAETYTDYMAGQVKYWVDDAERNDITIHTIEISDDDISENSWDILRQLLKDSSWDPALLNYMASTTDGEMFEAKNYDAGRIASIYRDIAKDVRVRLAE